MLLAVLATLLVGAGVLTALEKTHTIDLFKGPNKTAGTSPDGVNYNPPTEQEVKEVEDRKEAIVKQQEAQNNPTPPPTSSNKKAVKPVIVRANGGEVSGYVPGIVEEGGTCIAVFKNGASEVKKTSTGIADASTTVCPPISYAGTAVQPGWQVTLHYESNVSQGASDATQVN